MCAFETDLPLEGRAARNVAVSMTHKPDNPERTAAGTKAAPNEVCDAFDFQLLSRWKRRNGVLVSRKESDGLALRQRTLGSLSKLPHVEFKLGIQLALQFLC